ncbi:unnamed protein product [Symbiodinium sp. CCMP2456]|nr:unnamed protein product [Symbiodinium sp. CCMP2456]
MAKRSANLLVVALVACALYVLLPGESFVAPQPLRTTASQEAPGAFAQAPSFQAVGGQGCFSGFPLRGSSWFLQGMYHRVPFKGSLKGYFQGSLLEDPTRQ